MSQGFVISKGEVIEVVEETGWNKWRAVDGRTVCAFRLFHSRVRAELELERRASAVLNRRRPIRPRDSQRRKLYAAERCAFAALSEHPRDATADEIRGFLRALCEVAGKEPNFYVRLSSRRGKSTANFGTGEIRISKSHLRRRWVWVHELAHVFVSSRAVAAHGREYAAIYLQLTEAAFGRVWRDALAAAFDGAGVKWRARKQLTPEQRERLRERGRQLAATKGGVSE